MGPDLGSDLGMGPDLGTGSGQGMGPDKGRAGDSNVASQRLRLTAMTACSLCWCGGARRLVTRPPSDKPDDVGTGWLLDVATRAKVVEYGGG